MSEHIHEYGEKTLAFGVIRVSFYSRLLIFNILQKALTEIDLFTFM